MNPGKTTTEYEKASRAEMVGYGSAAVGFMAALVAALLGMLIAAAVCALAALSGVTLVAVACHSYAKSRGSVKAAHESSKSRVLHQRGI